ncbi:MAG: glycosyltransferase [Myxococcaceae bacterium]|nr:glycosyltransferase [Myxococcaceae bacterium]
MVVPVYGCESCLRALYARLVATLTAITPDFEIILVDDRSPQLDWSVIRSLAEADPRVRGLRLCRNFGQHYAIAAGLQYAEGNWTVVMDCDLQDPPEEIAKLYRAALAGSPVVFSRRMNRKDAAAKRGLSRAFSKVHGLLGGFEVDSSIGNFSIISRRVVLQLRQFRERNRNYGMEVHWLGFATTYVDVEHAARHSGKSTYTLAKQLRHALTTVLSQSTRPLYASAGLGFVMALGAAIYTLHLTIRHLLHGQEVEGWTSVMVSLFFLFGVLIMNLGVLGLYLGSVFLELKQRPSFVVEQTTFDPSEAA